MNRGRIGNLYKRIFQYFDHRLYLLFTLNNYIDAFYKKYLLNFIKDFFIISISFVSIS
jgi:hypothetical protein